MSWHYPIPPIYTEKSFFFSVGIKKSVFGKLIEEKINHYKVGRRVKQNGGYRTIYRPDNELKKTLQIVYIKYLSKIDLPPFVHCGVKGRSISTSVREHNKYEFHLSLDIRAFFDEINTETLRASLKKIKVPKTVSEQIISLCIEDNRLPQGFPTSSYLSSLVLCVALEQLVTKLRIQGIKFSAYADDLLLSANSHEALLQAENSMKETLSEVGLSLNEKRKFWSSKDSETTLGLYLHPFPSVRRSKIKEIEKIIYDSKKNSAKIPQIELKRMRGKISFYSSINKNKLTERTKKEITTNLKEEYFDNQNNSKT